MVYIFGLMVKNMMDNGVMVNKMVKDYIYFLMEHINMGFGKMVRELIGLNNCSELFYI